MKTNEELQTAVQDAIKWGPLLHAAEIGVTAKNGIVFLTGTVDNYAKKTEAKNAVKKVSGVKVLVDNIEVKFSNSWSKTDAEIAREVLNAIKANWYLPKNKVKVKIENGWVTLEGELPLNFQRKAVKNLIVCLLGVKGVTNNIIVKSDSQNQIEQNDIKNALRKSSIFDCNIRVWVYGATVTLTGTVNFWHQKDEASRIAGNTPGIWNIKNELTIGSESLFD